MILDIMNTETSYSPEYDSFCFENCIRQLLELYRIEDAYQFLDASLYLQVVDKSNAGFAIASDCRNVLPQYLKKIKTHIADNERFYPVWEKNKKMIQKNIPVIVAVDPYFLEYTPLYNKDHGSHAIILCGFSPDEEYVEIIDHYEWFYKGKVKFDQYMGARSSSNPKAESIYSGSSINNAWFEIEKNGWAGNKRKLLLQIITATLNQFYIPVGKKANVYQGITGLKHILNKLTDYREREAELKSQFLNKLYRTLRPLMKKKKFFQYYLLQSLPDILPEASYKDLNQFLENNINDWNMLILTFVRSSMLKTANSYEQVINLFMKLIDDEEQICEYLTDLKNQVSARK